MAVGPGLHSRYGSRCNISRRHCQGSCALCRWARDIGYSLWVIGGRTRRLILGRNTQYVITMRIGGPLVHPGNEAPLRNARPGIYETCITWDRYADGNPKPRPAFAAHYFQRFANACLREMRLSGALAKGPKIPDTMKMPRPTQGGCTDELANLWYANFKSLFLHPTLYHRTRLLYNLLHQNIFYINNL